MTRTTMLGGLRGVRLLAFVATLTVVVAGKGTPATTAEPREAYTRVGAWTSNPQGPPPEAFLEPRGVTVDPFDGTVFVVDGGNRRVQIFQPDGTHVRTLGGLGASADLVDPLDVAVQGSLVFVTDPGRGRVAVFTVDGDFLMEWPGLAGPWGIAAAPDGRVFVVENEANRIAVFRADGRRLATWGVVGGGAFGVVRPRGADVLPDGRLVVADYGNERLIAFGRDGLPDTDSGRLAAPLDVAVDATGRLYVVHEDGAIRSRGSVAGLPADGGVWPLEGAAGVGATAKDAVFATFQDDLRPMHGVQRYAGRPLLAGAVWGGVPAPLGRLDAPRRIAAGAQALVLDSWRRAQRFDASGQAVAQIPVGAVNDLEPAPDDGVHVVRDGEALRLVADGSATWRYPLPATGNGYPWGVSLAWDRTDDRLAVLDLGGQRVHFVDGRGQPVGSWSFRPAAGAEAMLWDLAPAPNGYYFVNRKSDVLERRSRAGVVLAAWPVPGGPIRVASDGAGHAFVLNRHGWIWKYTPGGALLAVWLAADGAPEESQPSDLAVDEAGRVLVTDTRRNVVAVFALDPTAAPGDIPTFEPRCTPRGDKAADPTALLLGAEATITLTVSGSCPGVANQADIALVLDHSGSMAPAGKLDAAQQAALAFLDAIDWADARVAVVGFNQDALVQQALTANKTSVAAALSGLVAGGGTDIAEGLDTARGELTSPRRRLSAVGIVILLTDGGSNPVAASQAADQAKLEGLRIFTIGFGPDAATALLMSLASAPDDYYFAPDGASLADIYRAIAVRVTADVLFTTLTVTDVLPDNMRYVNDSGVPAPSVNGQILVWQLSDIPLTGMVLRYRVLPLATGTWPTNVVATGEGSDGLGQRGQVTFPVPVVVVVVTAPTGTPPTPSVPTPNLSPTPTAVVPPTPTVPPSLRPVYLPLLSRWACLQRRQHVDVVLVVDTSDSMRDGDPTGGTKLDAALSAARTFVGLLAEGKDAAAVVYFNTDGAIQQPLTRERDRLLAALSSLPQAPGTRIDLGLAYAGLALDGPGRDADNLPVVVLLTDGRPSGTTAAMVLAAAEDLRRHGAVLYAVGLGEDVDRQLLGELAGAPERLVLAPDAAALEQIYVNIAGELPCLLP